MSGRRLLAIARKEVIQLRRDPRSLAMAFVLPLMLLVIFGYAISWDLDDIRVAVLDEDNSAASRDLLDAFVSSGYFRIVDRLDGADGISATLDRRKALAVFVVPPDFGQALRSGQPATLQMVMDGSDANTATIALGYAQAVVRTKSLAVALEGQVRPAPAVVQSRVWYNEELKSRDMIVPGLVAVVMMIVAAMLTSLTIAREWERGTMEQLASTPVSRAEVVFGKLLPYAVIGLVDVAACSLAGVFLFGVPLRGSPVLLMVLSFFFLVGSLGLGIFISAVTRSQLVATQMAMLATFLPAYLLSGFMFAISAMPTFLQVITLFIPARYFLVVTRGIFLKGVGAEVLWSQGLLMVAFAGLGITLAVRVFRKELA